MRRFLSGIAITLAAAAGVGCAVDEAPALEVDELAIVDGQLDTGHPAVAALVTGGAQFCTGTLVAPRVIVTAAHCLPPNYDVTASSIRVFFGDQIGGAGDSLAIDDVYVHPDWNKDVIPNDLGIVALTEDAAVEPVEMLGPKESIRSGETVTVVGFGITGSDAADNGTKRKGTAEVEDVDASTLYLGRNPELTCNGDSGGPLFVSRGGRDKFAGIHSRSDCETSSLDERVDNHKDEQIAAFVEAHGGGGLCMADDVCDESCSSDPDCGGVASGADDVVGGCASAGGASPLVALGLLALLARRRRRGS
jgi:uncharacterized protein (TIGR03382 family)